MDDSIVVGSNATNNKVPTLLSTASAQRATSAGYLRTRSHDNDCRSGPLRIGTTPKRLDGLPKLAASSVLYYSLRLVCKPEVALQHLCSPGHHQAAPCSYRLTHYCAAPTVSQGAMPQLEGEFEEEL